MDINKQIKKDNVHNYNFVELYKEHYNSFYKTFEIKIGEKLARIDDKTDVHVVIFIDPFTSTIFLSRQAEPLRTSYYNLDTINKVFSKIKKVYNFKNTIKTNDGIEIKSEDCVITWFDEKENINDCIWTESHGFLNISKHPEVVKDAKLAEDYFSKNYYSIYHDAMFLSYKTLMDNGKTINSKNVFCRRENIKFVNTVLLFDTLSQCIHRCICDQAVLNSHGYILSYKDNTYYLPKDMQYSKQKKFKEYNYLKFKFDTKQEAIEAGSVSTSFLAFNGYKNTFGVELETSEGYFPESTFAKYHIRVEKDGSVYTDEDNKNNDTKYGGEVITSVLQGDNGLIKLQELVAELAKRAKINSTAGVHVHVGKVDFSKKNIVLLYKLGLLIQDDLNNLLPPSRKSNVNEYCRALPSLDLSFDKEGSNTYFKIMIEQYYNTIFKLSCGHNPTLKYNSSTNHPRGAKVGYDHTNIRYCWLNMIPAIFNTRGNEEDKTVEIRNHSATLNFTKIKNWIKICVALVNYVELFPDDIMFTEAPMKIEDIVSRIYKGVNKENLLHYIYNRKELLNSEFYKEKEQEYLEKVNMDKLNKKQIILEQDVSNRI
jgi:hypothetical protein